MTPDDDGADGAQADSGGKLLSHFLEEMSWPSLVALGMVSFFFFYGTTNALIKFLGREVASFDFPIGPVIGAVSAITLVIVGAVIKLRSRS